MKQQAKMDKIKATIKYICPKKSTIEEVDFNMSDRFDIDITSIRESIEIDEAFILCRCGDFHILDIQYPLS